MLLKFDETPRHRLIRLILDSFDRETDEDAFAEIFDKVIFAPDVDPTRFADQIKKANASWAADCEDAVDACDKRGRLEVFARALAAARPGVSGWAEFLALLGHGAVPSNQPADAEPSNKSAGGSSGARASIAEVAALCLLATTLVCAIGWGVSSNRSTAAPPAGTPKENGKADDPPKTVKPPADEKAALRKEQDTKIQRLEVQLKQLVKASVLRHGIEGSAQIRDNKSKFAGELKCLTDYMAEKQFPANAQYCRVRVGPFPDLSPDWKWHVAFKSALSCDLHALVFHPTVPGKEPPSRDPEQKLILKSGGRDVAVTGQPNAYLNVYLICPKLDLNDPDQVRLQDTTNWSFLVNVVVRARTEDSP